MKIYKSTCIVYHPDCIRDLIAEVDTREELEEVINSFKIHYARIMPAINEEGAEDYNGIMIDYGSWSKFLYIDGITFNEYIGDRNET